MTGVKHIMAAPRKLAKPADPKNFEEALAELEELVEQMESGALALDDLLVNYQRGAQLIVYCKDKLQTVEQQVQVLEKGKLNPLSEQQGDD